ncbi:MAG: biotin--[acetyl-CoA-carboxylase] ligase [Gemmatimonadota bacterium]
MKEPRAGARPTVGSGSDDGEARLWHWEGEPLRVWQSLWDVPELEVWRRLGSTNDRARERARTSCEPYTVVIAEEQTAGRGREGRAWSSPAGAGLWMSVVLRPGVSGARRLAPILVGLAACRAVESVAAGTEPCLKWPNDVLVGGRKVCGILCEAAGDTVVAGIGVNVRQRRGDFPPDVRDSATSLERETGERISRGKLAGALLSGLRAVADDGGPPDLVGELAEELRRRDALRDRRVRLRDGSVVTARGIGRDGGLVVESEGGSRRTIVAGTVRPVGRAGHGGRARGTA